MDDKLYTVHPDTRITLSPLARELAKANGMTETEMAKHLLQQDKLRKSGLSQKQGENG